MLRLFDSGHYRLAQQILKQIWRFKAANKEIGHDDHIHKARHHFLGKDTVTKALETLLINHFDYLSYARANKDVQHFVQRLLALELVRLAGAYPNGYFSMQGIQVQVAKYPLNFLTGYSMLYLPKILFEDPRELRRVLETYLLDINKYLKNYQDLQSFQQLLQDKQATYFAKLPVEINNKVANYLLQLKIT